MGVGVIAELGLTDMQAAFVGHLVSGVEPAKAAELAGYANDCRIVASNLLRKPTVLAAVQHETSRCIGAVAPIALKVLVQIATDENAPKGVRVDAAKAILDGGGHGPRAPRSEASAEKPLTEMSADELRAVIEQSQAAIAHIAERATLVGGGRERPTGGGPNGGRTEITIS
jgi:phage terminase small subunit